MRIEGNVVFLDGVKLKQECCETLVDVSNLHPFLSTEVDGCVDSSFHPLMSFLLLVRYI